MAVKSFRLYTSPINERVGWNLYIDSEDSHRLRFITQLAADDTIQHVKKRLFYSYPGNPDPQSQTLLQNGIVVDDGIKLSDLGKAAIDAFGSLLTLRIGEVDEDAHADKKKRVDDDAPEAPLDSAGAVNCTFLQCAGERCEFTGGKSGYCSSCWKSLTPQEQQAATTKQKDLQPARSTFYAEEEARVQAAVEAMNKKPAKKNKKPTTRKAKKGK